MDWIHKRVQVLLKFCKKTSIKEVESGAREEFGRLQNKLERGEWITLTPVWVERPEYKEEGMMKSDRKGFGARPSGGGGRHDTIFNHEIDL